jgi:hypothetical protein
VSTSKEEDPVGLLEEVFHTDRASLEASLIALADPHRCTYFS